MATITNNNSNTVIGGSSGRDYIQNPNVYGANVTINAGDGNDYIYSGTEKTFINAGAGNDTIFNFFISQEEFGEMLDYGGKNSTLLGGAGDDSIKNHGENVSVDGGAGNDLIINDAKYVTLRGGAGDDTIEVSDKLGINHEDNVVEYAAGDGNDLLINYNSNDIIRITKGSVTGGRRGVGTNDTDVILQVSDGTDTGTITIRKGANKTITVIDDTCTEDEPKELTRPAVISNSDDNAVLSGGNLDDYIENSGADVVINSDGGADYAVNSGRGVLILGGNGNDTIYNSGADTTIDGGAGNDFVKNEGENVSISGGTGDDLIENTGEGTTVNAGTGNDTISISGIRYASANNDAVTVSAGSVIEYAAGDGNDVVYGFDANSTLHITSGSVGRTISGLDVIFKVGSGSITLKNAVGKVVNWINPSGKLTSMVYGEFGYENDTDYREINGDANANTIYNSGVGATINGGGGNDTIKNVGENVVINGGAGNDYINDQSRGSSTINGGAGNDTIELANDASHVLEYTAGEGNDVIIGYGETDSIRLTNTGSIGRSTVSGNDVIFTLGGGTLTLKDGAGKTITFVNANNSVISAARYGAAAFDNSDAYVSVKGTTYGDTITNWADGVTVQGGDGADYIENYGEQSRLYGEGGADTVVNFANNSTIQGGNDGDYIDNSADNVRIFGNAGNDYISNSGRKVTITGGAGDDYIEGSEYGDVFIFNYTDGNDVIANFDANDTLQLASGSIAGSLLAADKDRNDLILTVKGSGSSIGTVTLKDIGDKSFTLVGSNYFVKPATSIGDMINEEENIRFSVREQDDYSSTKRYYVLNTAPNVTLRSGRNADTIEGSEEYGEVFEYASDDGKDVILNFGENDSLKAVSGTIMSTMISDNGADLLVTIGTEGDNGELTLKGAASFAFKQHTDKTLLTVVTKNNIGNSSSNTLITGTDAPDSIRNTGDNVTIAGGAGDDTVTGSSYGELIRFGATDGADVIVDFGLEDTIKIDSGEISSHTPVGDDYVFYIRGGNYSGLLTLKGLAKEKFVIDGSTITRDGVNSITSHADNITLKGKGKDYITNSGSNVTIQAGTGNDTIIGSNNGDMYVFRATDNNNVVTNFNTLDTLRATFGTITAVTENDGDYIVDISGAGMTSKVMLKNTSSLTPSLSSDSKTLRMVGNGHIVPTYHITEDDTLFVGSSDAEYIINASAGVTIQPNGGNDTIEGSDHAELYRIGSDGGNNLIKDFSDGDSLRCTAGSITATAISGNDVLVTLKGLTKEGTVTLGGAASKTLVKSGNVIYVNSVNVIENNSNSVKVTGTGGNDFIYNYGDNVSIQPNGGNDTMEGSNYGEMYLLSSAYENNVITNFGANDTIKITGGSLNNSIVSGDDVIFTLKGASFSGINTLLGAAGYTLKKSGAYITVDNGAPTIRNDRDDTAVSGTGAAEWIVNSSSGVTIRPGGGNDTIEGSDEYGEVYALGYTNGDNVILNFGDNDTLRRTTTGTMSTRVSGNDVIVSIANAAGTSVSTVRLTGKADKKFSISGSNLTVARQDTITNDTPNTVWSGEDYAQYMVNTTYGVSLDGNGGNDTFEGSAEGETFLFDAMDGNNVIVNFDENDVLRVMSGTVSSEKAIGNNFVVTAKDGDYTGTMTILGAADSIGRSGNSFTVKNVVKKLLNRQSNMQVNGTSFNDLITNTGANATLNGKAGNDTLVGSNSYAEMYQFGADGGMDLIKNFGKEDSLQIVSGRITTSLRSGTDLIVHVRNSAYGGVVTLGGAAGYTFKQLGDVLTVDSVSTIVNREDGTAVAGTSGADRIVNSGSKVTIKSGGGADTIEGSNFGEVFSFSSADGDNIITNFGENDTLYCSAGKIADLIADEDDVIVSLQGTSYKGTVRLVGAAGLNLTQSGRKLYVSNVNNILNTSDSRKVTGSGGNDYIVATGEHVTIQPGAGNDTIYGSDTYGDMYLMASNTGDNVILNFGKGDTLKCTAGSISATAKSGNDVLVTLKGSQYKGIVTLKDAAKLKLVKSGSYITVDSVTDINNTFDSTKVAGTGKRDYITNSGEYVTIQSGGGNDTIEGSTFAETFLFSSADGNNVITNFGLNDTLRCTAGNIATVRTVGSNAVVSLKGTSYSGTVTLVGAGGYKFTQNGRNLYVASINKITNRTDGAKVQGTSGKDYIINTAEHVTIQGSGGSDTITGSDEFGDFFAFSSAHGDNVITNFGKNDTLRMTAGNTLTFATRGDDYVVTLKGASHTGHATLQGAAAIGELVKSTDGKSLMLYTNETIVIGEMPGTAEDYWFTSDDAAIDNDVDALMSEAAIDTSLGKLTQSGDELLTSLGAANELDKALTASTFERRKINK